MEKGGGQHMTQSRIPRIVQLYQVPTAQSIQHLWQQLMRQIADSDLPRLRERWLYKPGTVPQVARKN